MPEIRVQFFGREVVCSPEGEWKPIMVLRHATGWEARIALWWDEPEEFCAEQGATPQEAASKLEARLVRMHGAIAALIPPQLDERDPSATGFAYCPGAATGPGGVMRTVGEIVDACQEEQPATEQELRLALLSLYYVLQMSCPHDYEQAGELKLRMRAKENFERQFRMLKATPEVWLGERWTPGTDANAKGREQSKRVAAAFNRRRK